MEKICTRIEEESIEATRQNHADKLEKLYADLKRSRITNETAPTEIDVTTTETALEKIRILLRNQKREHSKVVSSQYEIECVLYKLKTSLCNNAKELFKTLLTGIMSVSYA